MLVCEERLLKSMGCWNELLSQITLICLTIEEVLLTCLLSLNPLRYIVLFVWPLELMFACIGFVQWDMVIRPWDLKGWRAHKPTMLFRFNPVTETVVIGHKDKSGCFIVLNKRKMRIAVSGWENLSFKCQNSAFFLIRFVQFTQWVSLLLHLSLPSFYVLFFCKCSALLGDTSWTEDAREPSVFLTAWHCAVSHERSVKWA